MLDTAPICRCRCSILRWGMSDRFTKWRGLANHFEKLRLDFIRTDLEVCFTFVDIVKTEYAMGNLDHAERTLAQAEKGYSTLCRLMAQTKGLQQETQNELQARIERLRERLDGLKQPR
jgi:hypothetical protein